MSFSGAELEALLPRLRRYAYALARHPVRPDDLVQDTLERAWSRRRQWQPGTDLRAWLFTILHHTFISELRRFAVRGYDTDSAEGAADLDPGRSHVETSGSQVGVMLDIERALTALPIEQRAVVLLVGLEDLSYREAAEVLGIPVGTVMSRLSRGRARLRELMDGTAPRRDVTATAPVTSSGDGAASLKWFADTLMDASERFRSHAYVDGELTPDEAADYERLLAEDQDALADVAALRAQKHALHARYDDLLTAAPKTKFERVGGWAALFQAPSHAVKRAALAATLLVAAGAGLAGGWIARGRADARDATAAIAVDREAERRLQAFVEFATVSHAIFVPEVRHPVEVGAADEAHLVAWLSKRLDAPLVVPHLGDAGWSLLGGRLLPAQAGPVAQFMYQDARGRRLTLAVSRAVSGRAVPAGPAADPSAAFRIADENGSTVFYWIDARHAYALTGKLDRSEMTALATRVYQQLDR